ncbi:uncharacterized protein BO66DRAFT_418955 [Aspergillus aculeatinus CBS 121060]|uniref:Uncharacterized protein n=1 Tax=Aspergillus aculeatinus CBS 121060 TaxID=1448322 RepID=A0ACD1HG69_9EURO|nr:hypothetical protein BO66DRAFT_418955 [Aspergillus aculeatinus CBS 121060]RAH72420.1 hypothetical protein BO66DRAFT_418955 [Aspergillus aculeatinus CBS 121060]
MTPVQRLNYLFAREDELLKMDTRLNPQSKEAKLEGTEPENTKPESIQLGNLKHDDEHKDDRSEGVESQKVSSQKHLPTESDLEGPELEELVLGELQHLDSEESTATNESLHEDPSDKTFTPIIALSRYPYKLIKDDSLSQQIASRFFDKNQFWARSWDIYYHYTPSSLGCRCILLTPARHARRLLGEINRTFKCTLQLPAERDMGLVLSFDNDAYPQPKFLGTSTNREAKDRLQARVPPPSERYLDPWKDLGDEHRELAIAYEAMLEAACDAMKSKRKTNAAQKQQQRMELEHRRKESLLRAQQYLGMRPAGTIDESLKYAPFNMDAVAPFAFWKDPIFVSVDVEWNERCSSQITEVGLSVLDMRKLHGVRPSSMDGVIWRRAIRSRHLRVREYSHLVNNEFVRGCPGDFRFGTSEFVGLENLKGVVQEAFQQVAVAEKKEDESEDRHVVLVGHSLAADLEHLRKIGVTLEMVNDRLDTAGLHCAMHADLQQQQQPMQPRSLGTVMTELGLEPWHLHNAGNDAHYALEALVASILGYKAGN